MCLYRMRVLKLNKCTLCTPKIGPADFDALHVHVHTFKAGQNNGLNSCTLFLTEGELICSLQTSVYTWTIVTMQLINCYV